AAPAQARAGLLDVDLHELVVAIARVERADLGAAEQLGEPLGVGDVDRQRAGDPRVDAGRGGGRHVVARDAAGGQELAERRRARLVRLSASGRATRGWTRVAVAADTLSPGMPPEARR